ncbi:hypothetical protein HELRODRAFT_172749 [Helobdella robusta]|uniref:Uncharacterized protein n=1 Tax=Helobdella robusta TaxID=6412 RepID=T1F5W6_HELRO|nr:hypothetical protein HELRODRAFT_172749 [Helobdella robusta]ESO04379.1 hypothetical protein HELRODRAFT_172749 [Helobdella robusta]
MWEQVNKIRGSEKSLNTSTVQHIDANTLNTHFASMSTNQSYKIPPTKATTINSHQHQQFTPYSVLHMLTKACQCGTGFQTFHALKTLRSHGLRGVKLFDITESLIISRIKYAAPSWSGFATQQQLQQLQSLIKKLITRMCGSTGCRSPLGLSRTRLLKISMKLENRYGTSGHEESYRYELQTLRHKPVKVGDTVDKRFFSALIDADLELKVREREPRNIDDSLRIAQRLEVSKNLVNSSYKFIPRVRNMQDTTEDRMKAVERQIDSLRQSLDVLRDHEVRPTVPQVRGEKVRKSGVYVARTLLPKEYDGQCVRVLNLKDESRLIKQETRRNKILSFFPLESRPVSFTSSQKKGKKSREKQT